MKKKTIVFLICLLIILSGVGAFIYFSIPPKEGLSEEFKKKAVAEIMGRQANLNPEAQPTGSTSYKGKYITFSYPAKAKLYEFRENKKSSILEDLSFDIKDPRLIFNMTVQEAPLGSTNLSDVPAVRLREDRIYEYEKSEITADHTTGLSYYKKGTNPEKSGFFLSGGKLFTLSVTGVQDGEVKKLFDDVLKTVLLGTFSK